MSSRNQPRWMTMTSALALAFMCLVYVRPAAAQDWLKGIADPTRPPAEMLRRAASSGNGAASGASSPEEAASAVPPAAPLALYSIRYDAVNSEGIALINEQLVKAGDTINGLTILTISRDAVVLSGPNGVRRLTLFGEVEDMSKKPARKHKRRRKEEK
jgi:hypothetical protein